MAIGKVTIRRRGKDEAEKPFWISFADLMSALMVLFLVVMTAAMLSVTKRVSAIEVEQVQHDRDVDLILRKFEEATHKFPGIKVIAARRVIDFGERAQFPFNSWSLSGEQRRLLREFVPEILELANDALGKRILKRIVVEGFTDKTGTYLGNLNLSLQRSQSVLCAMFEPPIAGESPLTTDQLREIRALFMVGGYSFNAAKDTDEHSRRVEMRLEFLGLRESRQAFEAVAGAELGTCALD